MARKAANHATNINAVLLACERSRVFVSLDQQHRQAKSMPKEKKEVRANDGDEEVFEVEDIRDDRFNSKAQEKMFLIKWKGYSEEDNTWEKESNLNCPLILKHYYARIKKKRTSKRLQDSRSEQQKSRRKPLDHKNKHAKQLTNKAVARLLHKRTVKKCGKVKSRNKSPPRHNALKVKIPLNGLPLGLSSSKTEDNSQIQCDDVSSSLFSHNDFSVDSSSCDESFLQDESYAFSISDRNPLLEKLLLPWETTSADVPISVDFCEYNEFFTKDPGGTLIHHYPSAPSIVSIEGADSISVSVGSPPPIHVDNNFSLTLSPSLSVSSVTSLTTASDIDVVNDVSDPAPIISSNDSKSTEHHVSPSVVNESPCCVRPACLTKERHRSSSPRFRMTIQRVRRHSSMEYATLMEGSLNGLNCSLNKGVLDEQLVQPYSLRARDYQQELKEWEASLNSKCKGKEAPILLENKYDEYPIPKDFEYVCTNLYGKGVPNPADHEPVTYCKCQKCGIGDSGCCPSQLEASFPYYSNGRVRVSPGMPVYECNSACVCGPDCCNRVVQKLRSTPLCIFRTGNAKGWGVKAVTEIKKNSFVCEYTGEVIMFDEAERRGAVANAKGLTYLFDLDFHSEDDGCCFSIDASRIGNISHFFNHSCDPNLTVYSVWVDFIDPRLPRIAFFAKRNIHEGEELTFDYQISYTSSHYQHSFRVKCLCGSKNCQKYLM